MELPGIPAGYTLGLPFLQAGVEFIHRGFQYRPNFQPYLCSTDDFQVSFNISSTATGA